MVLHVRDAEAGAVAQLGERLVRNEEVSGSIPLSSTKPTPFVTIQLSERHPLRVRVPPPVSYIVRKHFNFSKLERGYAGKVFNVDCLAAKYLE